MDRHQNWVEALQISPQQLTEWSAQSPSGVPLLVWCMEQGLISAERYLQWASEHYQVPILQPDFFEHAFDPSYLEAERNNGPWSAWFFPIGQWEDVTYIACVEPPSEPSDEKFCFVLADAKTLRHIWGETSPSIRTVANEAPSQPSFSFEVSTPQAPSEPAFPTNEPVSTPDIDAPAGLDFSKLGTAKPLPTDLSLLDLNVSPPPAPTASEEFDAPAGLVLNIQPTEPTPATDSTDDQALILDEVEFPQSTPSRPQPAAQQPAVPSPAPSAAATARASLKLSPEAEAAVRNTFAQIRETHHAVMLMQASGSNSLTLLKWDGLALPVGQKISVDLEQPTLFRIVAKTAMPYHGFVVDLPSHRELFKTFKLEELPECVTAVPLKSKKDELLGVLVAIGEEKHQSLEHLKVIEQRAAELITVLEPLWSVAA